MMLCYCRQGRVSGQDMTSHGQFWLRLKPGRGLVLKPVDQQDAVKQMEVHTE